MNPIAAMFVMYVMGAIGGLTLGYFIWGRNKI